MLKVFKYKPKGPMIQTSEDLIVCMLFHLKMLTHSLNIQETKEQQLWKYETTTVPTYVANNLMYMYMSAPHFLSISTVDFSIASYY